MPNTTHTGSLKTGTQGAAEQAAAIGATIGPDGWWYLNGKKLSPQEADQLTQRAGVAQTTTDDAHGSGKGTLRNIYDAEPQWLKTVQTLGIDTGHPVLDQSRTKLALAAVGPIAAAGAAAGGAGMAASGAAGTGAAGTAGAGTGAAAGAGVGGLLGKVLPMVGKLPSLSGIGDFLTGNNGMNALGLGQAANTFMLQQKASDLANRSEKIGMDEWNANAPLRTAGRAGIANPVDKKLPALGVIRSANPFARGA